MEKKINRRDFLRLAGGAGVTLTTTAATHAGGGAGHWMKSNDTAESSAMTLRDIAGTGLPVSLLGYGGMRWPETTDIGGRNIVDQDKVDALIDYAVKHGVNYYDTAPVYHHGQSERVMGKALSRYPRKSFFIATKLSSFNHSEWTLEAAKKMYEHSFSELGVDYIDFYLLHSLGAGKDAFMKRFVDNGVLDFLIKEKEKERIKQLGFSFHGDRESFLTALNYDIKWDFVQIQLNYYDWMEDSDKRPSAKYLYTELEKRHIPIVVMEPLLGGRLAKISDKLLAELKRREPEQTPASWAFRFVGSKPQVQTILSGMTYMDHLIEDIKIFSPLKPLDEVQQHFLEETAVAMMKYPTIPCTACRYCMPCPSGIDIPANFAYYNKCLIEGNIPASRQSVGYVEARKHFLGDLNKSVPLKQQYSKCTACGHCLPLCPQHINIPDQMKRIDKLVGQLKNNN